VHYRKDIDGLRALAVLPVVLFHMGFASIAGGFLGVDVFFVISGYLISSIILGELEERKFSFVNFWKRRIQRILPALSAMVITTIIAKYIFTFWGELPGDAYIGFTALLSFANIAIWLTAGDYWGSAAEAAPFLHTWSLSVEEQFYLFWPMLLFLLFRSGIGKRGLQFVLISFTIVSLALFLISSSIWTSASFYLLPTRAWELMAGGVVALYPSLRDRMMSSQKLSGAISTAGLLLVIGSYANSTHFSQYWTPACVVGACLIILSSSNTNLVGRFLSVKPLVFIGKISYSMYLWHWPVLKLYEPNGDAYKVWELVALSLVVLSLSVLSNRFIEQPFRIGKKGLYRTATLFSVALCFSFIASNVYYYYDTSSFKAIHSYGAFYDARPSKPERNDLGRYKDEGVSIPDKPVKFSDSYRFDGISAFEIGTSPKIVMIGDSHAAIWSRIFDDVSRDAGVQFACFSVPGINQFFHIPLEKEATPRVGFTAEQFLEFRTNILEKISRWDTQTIVIISRWSLRKEPDLIKLKEMLKFAGAENSNVLILGQPPEIAIGDNNSAQYLSYKNFIPAAGESHYIAAVNKELVNSSNKNVAEICSEFKNCTYINVAEKFQLNSKSMVFDGSDILYYDDDHLSYEGTRLLKAEIESVMFGSKIKTSDPAVNINRIDD
jgi:peptidoglycan/LPS O-acetylase OafA/YrhL